MLHLGREHFRSAVPLAGDEAMYTYNGALGDAFEWTVVGGEITTVKAPRRSQ